VAGERPYTDNRTVSCVPNTIYNPCLAFISICLLLDEPLPSIYVQSARTSNYIHITAYILLAKAPVNCLASPNKNVPKQRYYLFTMIILCIYIPVDQIMAPNWGPPPNLLSVGYRGTLTPGIKRPGCEADNSPSFSAEVKNAWNYTSSPQYIYMARCLIKHRVYFTFTFKCVKGCDITRLCIIYCISAAKWTVYALQHLARNETVTGTNHSMHCENWLWSPSNQTRDGEREKTGETKGFYI